MPDQNGIYGTHHPFGASLYLGAPNTFQTLFVFENRPGGVGPGLVEEPDVEQPGVFLQQKKERKPAKN